MIKFRLIASFSFIIFLVGCTTTSLNNIYDKDAASSVAGSFYNYCRKKNYNAALALFDQSITGAQRRQIENLLIARDTSSGENHWASLMNWQTYTQSGMGNPSFGRYELIYKVAYDKDTTNEYFKLMKDTKTDSIKITDYQISHFIGGIQH